jgi:hypothetical protein
MKNKNISIGLKRYYKKQKRNNLIQKLCSYDKVSTINLLIIGFVGAMIILGAYSKAVEASQWELSEVIIKKAQVKELTVEDKIKRSAIKNGVDVNTALRIAQCESSMGKNIISKTSTARGIYQFIFKTWDTYCEGDVYDEDANIDCFMKLYNKFPYWWECK